MLAYHNDNAVKQFYIDRIDQHAKADEIIKGTYWENGKGCAVGCTIHDNEHYKYEDELGIPQILARLEDRTFENLPNELAMTWPKRFLESIKVGADLSKVWPKFAIFLLTDSTQCNSRHPQCYIVAKAYQDELDGQKINWRDVRSTNYATYAAACAAACAVDDAAACAAACTTAYATYAAACAAACAVDDAAYATYAAACARQQAYISQSKKLLELLGECE